LDACDYARQDHQADPIAIHFSAPYRAEQRPAGILSAFRRGV
jgi:hypothetical protein